MAHPYSKLAPHAHWKAAVQRQSVGNVDPVVGFRHHITPSDRVATAGSCFAQHIARHLKSVGFNYYVAEEGHPIADPATNEAFGFGLFSARYGNIYTSRQLLQLFDRAFGQFEPVDKCWCNREGAFVDPFRPTAEPRGFASEREMLQERASHLKAVRRMFETLDVFVFTLGLTECWVGSEDGAAFPVCPGVSGGTFDPEKYQFLNLSVTDVVDDLKAFLAKLQSVNPSARVILTVSPVPLMATAEDQHVLVSTTLSKSILRVAADMIQKEYAHVAYFPSFEIITGNFNRGAYFADDLRSVTEDGVQHVMRLFLKHAAGVEVAQATQAEGAGADNLLDTAKRVVEVICDEEALVYNE